MQYKTREVKNRNWLYLKEKSHKISTEEKNTTMLDNCRYLNNSEHAGSIELLWLQSEFKRLIKL